MSKSKQHKASQVGAGVALGLTVATMAGTTTAGAEEVIPNEPKVAEVVEPSVEPATETPKETEIPKQGDDPINKPGGALEDKPKAEGEKPAEKQKAEDVEFNRVSSTVTIDPVAPKGKDNSAEEPADTPKEETPTPADSSKVDEPKPAEGSQPSETPAPAEGTTPTSPAEGNTPTETPAPSTGNEGTPTEGEKPKEETPAPETPSNPTEGEKPKEEQPSNPAEGGNGSTETPSNPTEGENPKDRLFVLEKTNSPSLPVTG